jgi:hypothetical protein
MYYTPHAVEYDVYAKITFFAGTSVGLGKKNYAGLVLI